MCNFIKQKQGYFIIYYKLKNSNYVLQSWELRSICPPEKTGKY